MLTDDLPFPEKTITRRRVSDLYFSHPFSRAIALPLFDLGLHSACLCEHVVYQSHHSITDVHKFSLVLQGQMRVDLNDDTHLCGSRTLAYCPPGTRFHRQAIGPVWWIRLDFEDTPFRQLFGEQGPYVKDYESATLLYLLLRPVFEARGRRDAGLIQHSLTRAAMAATLLEEEGRQAGPLPIAPHEAPLASLVSEIREDPGAPWSIRDMTDRMHISEATLARAVHKHYRMSPLQLLIQIRISAASRLLMTSSLPVAEVGRRVGYQSPSSFTRLFIKHMRVSPGKFRRKSQVHGPED